MDAGGDCFRSTDAADSGKAMIFVQSLWTVCVCELTSLIVTCVIFATEIILRSRIVTQVGFELWPRI